MVKTSTITIIISLLFVTINLQAQIWEGDYFINSQEDINNFAKTCKCTEISGGLFIRGNQINNLNGLGDLYRIDGNLNIENTSNLVNLGGLSNLKSIGRSLYISRNRELKNLNGLAKLTSIGESLQIRVNSRLTNLNGLSKVTSTHLQDIYIYDNNQLKDINIFSQLKQLKGSFLINRNEQLNSIQGFSSLTKINGRLTLLNSKVENLEVFGNLEEALNGLDISQNRLMKTINLPKLNGVGTVTFSYNERVNQIMLPNLDIVNGNISLINNHLLANLDGFSSLNHIKGHLTIRENWSLANIEGLQNLKEIERNVELRENTSLSECCILSCKIRDRIVGSNIIIQNNGNGCANATELYFGCEEFCLLSSTDNILTPSISFYPMPAEDFICVVTPSKQQFNYTIYSTDGRLVTKGQLLESKIKVTHLLKGLYVLHLNNTKNDMVTKFIKQ